MLLSLRTLGYLNSIYLQVQHVVWVQHLYLLSGPLRCCCTGLNPLSPPSLKATAASCFSTSLQQKHSVMHQYEKHNRALSLCCRQITYLCDPSEGDHMFLQSSFSCEEKNKFWTTFSTRFSTHCNVNTYLFLQCHAQTTIKMRAVRTMTNTGTRTAASATSKSRSTTINTICFY